MSLPRLYYHHPLAIGLILRLPVKPSQYLLHVLRLKKHQHMTIFNGQGGEFTAALMDIKKHNAVIKILEYHTGITPPILHIHLGQVLSKGQHMDYALQKATELGVSAVTPLYTQYSICLPASRLHNKLSHWHGILTHAAAQSKRCDIPVLYTPENFSSTTLLHHNGLKLICTLKADHYFSFNDAPTPPKNITLLIGAEGGFSKEETEVAITHGFKCLSLGKRTLRTETATATALSMIQYQWGDLTQ
jgi:16S rRNA (uracil1498-N3)-methyltransferase